MPYRHPIVSVGELIFSPIPGLEKMKTRELNHSSFLSISPDSGSTDSCQAESKPVQGRIGRGTVALHCRIGTYLGTVEGCLCGQSFQGAHHRRLERPRPSPEREDIMNRPLVLFPNLSHVSGRRRRRVKVEIHIFFPGMLNLIFPREAASLGQELGLGWHTASLFEGIQISRKLRSLI